MKSNYSPFFVLFALFYHLSALSSLRITHQELIHIGTRLGYEGLDKGLCYGFSMTYATAILTHGVQQWLDRLDLLETYKNDADALSSELQSLRKKTKNNRKLAPTEKALLDIPAFYESLTLYQSPNSYASFFNKKFMRQSDMQRIFQLARPVSLEETDLSIVLFQILAFDGALFKHYLQRLGDILQHLSLTLPIILHNHNHAICLTYKHKVRSWDLMNIEDFGFSYTIAFKNNEIDLLVDKIFSGFADNPHGHSLMAINGISVDTDPKWIKFSQCMHKNYPITKSMVSQCNFYGIDLLHMVSKFGNLKLLKDILKHHQNINSCSPVDGITALMSASYFGHVDMVDWLLSCGANPNMTSPQNDHMDALHWACEWGHFDIAALLIQYGADVNWKDTHGRTPLFRALNKEHAEIVQLLLAHRANLYPNLMICSFRQGFFTIQQLCWYYFFISGVKQSVTRPNKGGRYLYFNASEVKQPKLEDGEDDNHHPRL